MVTDANFGGCHISHRAKHVLIIISNAEHAIIITTHAPQCPNSTSAETSCSTGLPQTAPEDELQTLQHTLIKAIKSQIEVRRKQVEDWIGKCEGGSGCARYSKALATYAEVAGWFSDLKAEKVSPRRYESAIVYQQKNKIDLSYETRAAHNVDQLPECPRMDAGLPFLSTRYLNSSGCYY
ncbi:uncharacterized protein BJ212DRAFT_397221 [Suillus subaureus]|uniref:Uncharacterized protein n=1 Tax=Suillus subaureus TaxID=48587 RepID=A0A9P7E7V1_9AGAM|nr:uncharacterized protein BJ212DRAFT_397221 [Suillus subaureus]KAG1813548.1 hypothetical protein BJ212DRAFT_397221 [Suillus subaureus]